MKAMIEAMDSAASTSDAVTRTDERALLDFLRERDVPCPLCRYNLRALTTPRCPECGRELRLSVGLVEPRQGAWLTGQIALTAAAGIGLMIILFCSANGWPEGGNPRQGLLNAAFTFHLLMIPAAAAWLMMRRRYLRRSRAVQWAGAALAIAAVAVGMVLLMMVTN
jgi:hypothetical protein